MHMSDMFINITVVQQILNDLLAVADTYSDLILFYLPLGIIGLWRWGVWVVKEFFGLFYRPSKKIHWESVSVITPVYNEDPAIFNQALKSWKDNKPAEIIAVIDYSDTRCIEVFKKFASKNPEAKLIVTEEPGKRPALARGIKMATGEIVALVDSDTIWTGGVLRHALAPFSDPKVGGVGTRQNVLNAKTAAQKIFDIQLDQRYRDEMPFLAVTSDVLTCLSGRTAFYRRKVLLPLLERLVNEKFWGRKVISGEDKRLTYLIAAAGWKLRFQSNARVYTPGVTDFKTLFKQRLRWSRNSWRADLRALFKGWAFKHPMFALHLIDRALQPFTVLVSPIYFVILLVSGLWEAALILFIWWHFSRLIKIFPHLIRKPSDIKILPVYVFSTFAFGVLRIFALFTLNTQGWITRWDFKRLPKFTLFKKAPAYLATLAALVLLFGSVSYYKQAYFVTNVSAELAPQVIGLERAMGEQIDSDSFGTGGSEILEQPVGIYTVQPGETLALVAAKFNIPQDELIRVNIAFLPQSKVSPGQKMKIPRRDPGIALATNFNTRMKYAPVRSITYDAKSGTVIVTGRGTFVTLSDIAAATGNKYLKEENPKVWLLSSNLLIQKGVSLNLKKEEVEWLKMESNSKKFVWLKTHNGAINIDGVKITSWDSGFDDFDRNYFDGRSFIVAKYSSVMNIENSDISFLGYRPPPIREASTFGVSWKIPGESLNKYLLTGEVKNNKFHHNYIGAYTYGAKSMLWQDNEFFNNVSYGLDPHDDSNDFLIEGNKIYANGSHGLILSKRCKDNLIRNNLVYDNKGHGIMLHEKSDQNLLVNNQVTGNTDGVVVYNSEKNIIRGNIISGNKSGIRMNVISRENMVLGNKIEGNSNFGIYFYEGAEQNRVLNNSLSGNSIALYIKTNENYIGENNISGNRTGIYLRGSATQNTLDRNLIKDNRLYSILTRTGNSSTNYITVN